MGQGADQRGHPSPLRYAPPSHSPYQPIERGGEIWELHGHGTKWGEGRPRLAWAKRRTWQGLQPIVELSRKGYPTGMALRHKAMQAIERRLERQPAWPKGDILLRPAAALG